MGENLELALGANDKFRHWMETGHLKSNMRGRTVRGGLTSFIGGNISFLLRMISTIILARLLLPEYFGLISMVTAVTVFADSFKDMGLGAATIQKMEITHEQVSTLFWVNTAIGAVLMLVVCGLSPVLAWFYKDQRLIPITVSISLNYFLGGIVIQHQALMKRQMLFTRLAVIQVAALLASTVAAILVALVGGTYWALVVSQVSMGLFSALGVFIACRWVPGRPRKGNGIGPMLRFGRDITGSNLAYFIATSVTQMVMGRLFGPVSLGLYSQAYKLVITPKEQTRVPLDTLAASALSALQTEAEKYREYSRKIIEMYALVNIALSTYLAIFAEPIVQVLLGQKWLEAIPLFRVFALTTLVSCLQFPVGFIMYSRAKTKQMAWLALVQSVINLVAAGIGLRWGVLGVAIGLAVASYLYALPSLWYGLHGTGVRVSVVFQACILPTAGTLIMTIVLLPYKLFVHGMGALPYLLGSMVLVALSLVISWAVLPGARAATRTYISYFSDLIQRKQVRSPS